MNGPFCETGSFSCLILKVIMMWEVLNFLSGFMNTKVFILILKFGVSKCFVFFEKFIIYSVRMV